MCVPLLLLLLLSLGAVDAAGPVSDFEFAGVVHQVPQEWSMQERQAANFVKFDMYPMALQAYQRMCSDDHRASLPPVVSAAARLQLGRMQFKIGHFEGAAPCAPIPVPPASEDTLRSPPPELSEHTR